MKSAFEHKPELRLSEFIIEKTIIIPDKDFEQMLHRPMDGQPFIEENKNLMYQDDEDVYHCILVTGKDRTDGILVECEGYGYARYAAYVPEAAALRYPSLSKMNQQLANAVDFIVADGTAQSTEGNWILTFEELEKYTGLCLDGKPFLQELLGDMLCDRAEVADLCIENECLDVTYYLDFCPNCQDQEAVTCPKLEM